MIEQMTNSMRVRSAALLLVLDTRLHRILQVWLLLAGFAAAARITFSPHGVPVAQFSTFEAYMLLVAAPFVSTILALRWFADGARQPQPSFRPALIGRWREVSRAEAEQHPLYGTSGIMVSLMVGMMLNVPIRALEYLAAMPPIPDAAPQWLSRLHFALTLDAVLFSSLYMVAFVAALRRVPIFPRLLLAIWIGDLAMQVMTAELVAHAGGLPDDVAISLKAILTNNVKKVLISMSLWLPYLLLSTRVNVTYRHRVPA